MNFHHISRPATYARQDPLPRISNHECVIALIKDNFRLRTR